MCVCVLRSEMSQTCELDNYDVMSLFSPVQCLVSSVRRSGTIVTTNQDTLTVCHSTVTRLTQAPNWRACLTNQK